jgi:hypothetical protein
MEKKLLQNHNIQGDARRFLDPLDLLFLGRNRRGRVCRSLEVFIGKYQNMAETSLQGNCI